MTDNVHRPQHYTQGRFPIECIEVTRHMTFLAGNAAKYLWRHAEKNGIEDLRKAAVYLRWAYEDRRTYAQGTAIPGRTGLLIDLAHEHVEPNADGIYWALMDIVHSNFDEALSRVESAIRDMERAA